MTEKGWPRRGSQDFGILEVLIGFVGNFRFEGKDDRIKW